MVGVVRTVEFNEEQNQSLLHFECTHIETSMRNEVLKFVYNMMPQNEKEVLEALEQTEDDENEELAQAQQEVKTEGTKGIEGENKEAASEVANDIAEAKGEGFDVKVMRQVLRLRKMDPADRAETEFLRDEYKKLLGMAE